MESSSPIKRSSPEAATEAALVPAAADVAVVTIDDGDKDSGSVVRVQKKARSAPPSFSEKVEELLEKALSHAEHDPESRDLRVSLHATHMLRKVLSKSAWVCEANAATGGAMKPVVVMDIVYFKGGPCKIDWQNSFKIPAEKFDLAFARLCAAGWMKRDTPHPDEADFWALWRPLGIKSSMCHLKDDELVVYHTHVYLGDYYGQENDDN